MYTTRNFEHFFATNHVERKLPRERRKRAYGRRSRSGEDFLSLARALSAHGESSRVPKAVKAKVNFLIVFLSYLGKCALPTPGFL